MARRKKGDKIDGWVALIILANVLSQWGAMQPLAIFALAREKAAGRFVHDGDAMHYAYRRRRG